MIQPHNGQRGVIGEQHGLQRLTNTLEALSQGQTQQQTRDTHLQERLDALTQQVATLTTGGKRLLLAVGVFGVLTLGLSGLVGWQVRHPPDLAYARALGALDTALVQQWSGLPKAAQESLSVTYGRLGLASPGDRQHRK
jgi:hypothetical protein